jgi:cobaltochelatase CobT
MSSKEDNFKEQFKQALISTAKVISEDYKLDVKKLDKDLSNKKTDFFDITNLSNKNDFVRLRAGTDSDALKKNFQIKKYLIKTYLITLLVNLYIILLKKLGMNFSVAKCSKELGKI